MVRLLAQDKSRNEAQFATQNRQGRRFARSGGVSRAPPVRAENKHTSLFFLFRSHPISGAKLCAPNMVCFLFAIF